MASSASGESRSAKRYISVRQLQNESPPAGSSPGAMLRYSVSPAKPRWNACE